MKLRINGFENPVSIVPGYVSVIEIRDVSYASRVSQSIVLGLGEDSIEPYVLWDDCEKILNISKTFCVIPSVFDLPWNDRQIANALLSKMTLLINENELIRTESESLGQYMQTTLNNLSFQMLSDYCFDTEWDVIKFLKAFGFKIDLDESDSLFDRMKKFLKLVYDVALDRVIVFIGFKQYFSQSQLSELFDLIENLKISVLSIESVCSKEIYPNEIHMTIDQHFLQI